jgi:hypothetical protein
MTLAVLWGIWPAILLGAFVSHVVYKWRLRPLAHFRAAQKAAEEDRLQVETVSALKSIYRCGEQRRTAGMKAVLEANSNACDHQQIDMMICCWQRSKPSKDDSYCPFRAVSIVC